LSATSEWRRRRWWWETSAAPCSNSTRPIVPRARHLQEECGINSVVHVVVDGVEGFDPVHRHRGQRGAAAEGVEAEAGNGPGTLHFKVRVDVAEPEMQDFTRRELARRTEENWTAPQGFPKWTFHSRFALSTRQCTRPWCEEIYLVRMGNPQSVRLHPGLEHSSYCGCKWSRLSCLATSYRQRNRAAHQREKYQHKEDEEDYAAKEVVER